MIKGLSRYVSLGILVFSFVCIQHSAFADIIDASSRVTAATVLPDRAIITREVKARISSGAHIVSIKNVPAGINEASLRVEGKGTAAVKIGAVEIKRIYLTELAGEAERVKLSELEAKQDERALVDAEIAALDTRSAFITRLVNAGAEKNDATAGAKIDFQPEKWTQAWALLQTGMADTQKELATKRIAIRKIDAAIQKLNQELAQVRSTRAMERRDVQIHLETAGDSDVSLQVTYQSNGVFWQPVYDARLDTVAGELTLEQYGQVRQQTGEDWSNIALTLSTARPSMGSEMPPLQDWRIGIFAPPPPMMLMQSNARSKRAMEGAAMDSSVSEFAAVEAPPAFVEAVQQQAVVVSTEYAAEFKVPGRVDLKSTADATKLYINAVKMKSVLSARVTPRLDPHAYLFVEATNSAEFPIIPGAVAKYRDGTFIGNAAMPLLRPTEKADLSFGTDDRVKVTYKRIKDNSTNPTLVVVGDISIVRQYETRIQNLHKTDLPITIYEQFPISDNPDVKTELVEDLTTKDFIKDPENRLGVILWKPVLKLSDEKSFTLGFKVKYPKGSPINGL